jgi:hypothetical protein
VVTPALATPRPPATPPEPQLADFGCDAAAKKQHQADVSFGLTSKPFDVWCKETRVERHFAAVQKHRIENARAVTPETLCAWETVAPAGLPRGTAVLGRDTFLGIRCDDSPSPLARAYTAASGFLHDVGAEDLGWVLSRWNPDEARVLAGLEVLGLTKVADVARRAFANRNDPGALKALQPEWDAAVEKNPLDTWVAANCLRLARACSLDKTISP